MKVWEETWEESDGVIEVLNLPELWQKHRKFPNSRFAWEQGTNVGAFGDMGGASPFNPLPEDVARAQLAAAAPEMVRVLLEVRQLMVDGHLDARGNKIEDAANACFDSIEAALRKAGVR